MFPSNSVSQFVAFSERSNMNKTTSMLFEINSSVEKILLKYLKRVISRFSDESDFELLTQILNSTVVPSDIFNFIANCSAVKLNVLDYIIKKRLNLDTKVTMVIKSLCDLKYDSVSVLELYYVLEESENLQLLPFEKLFIASLLRGDDPFTSTERYPSTNIEKRYQSTQSLLDEAICKVIYMADYEMLRHFLHCIKSNSLNFHFNHTESGEHHKVFKWLTDNIVRGCITTKNLVGQVDLILANGHQPV